MLRAVRIFALAGAAFGLLLSLLMPQLAAEPSLAAPLRASLAALGVVFVLAACGFEIADPPQSALRRDVLWGIGVAILAFVGLSPLLR